MKSRREMIAELEQITAQVNVRCDEIAEEIKNLESELQRVHAGVDVRIICGNKQYGYRRVGDRYRLVMFAGSEEEDASYKPLSDCSREQKIEVAEFLDDILEAILNAARERLKEAL